MSVLIGLQVKAERGAASQGVPISDNVRVDFVAGSLTGSWTILCFAKYFIANVARPLTRRGADGFHNVFAIKVINNLMNR